MEAAWLAASRGHEVTVFGASSDVGGKTRLHAALAGGESLSSVYDYQRLRADKAGVRFVLGTRAQASDVLALAPDAVVLASGSTPAWPAWLPTEYRDAEWFPDVRTVAARLLGRRTREEGVAILVDQDHTGFTYATAELLARCFAKVVLVSPREGVAAEEPLVNRQGIQRRLAALGVQLQSWSEPLIDEGIAEGRLRLRDVLGRDERVIDGVVLLTHATARVPDLDLLPALRAAGLPVHLIGDAKAPRSLLMATSEGYQLGLQV